MADPVTTSLAIATFGGTAVAGTALSVYGQLKAANAEQEAAQREADNRRLQAEEVLRRGKEKEITLTHQGEQLLGAQATGFGKSGITLEGSPLLAMETARNAITRDILESRRDSQFRADQLIRGADAQTILAEQRREAANWNVAGTILTSASNVAMAATGKKGF